LEATLPWNDNKKSINRSFLKLLTIKIEGGLREKPGLTVNLNLKEIRVVTVNWFWQ
jgi:hypothetical protein